MTPTRLRRLTALTLTALLAAVAIAACGSSSTSSSSASSSNAASAGGAATRPSASQRAKLAACLKQHGVTLPSRPPGGAPPSGSASGGGSTTTGGYGGQRRGGFFFGGGGAGGRFSNPKFRAAFQACGAQFGFRGRAGSARGRFRPTQAAVAKFASCVKQHGYTLPKANLSGNGPIYPRSIESNAKFQKAAQACQAALRPAGGAPPPGAGGGAGGSGPPASATTTT